MWAHVPLLLAEKLGQGQSAMNKRSCSKKEIYVTIVPMVKYMEILQIYNTVVPLLVATLSNKAINLCHYYYQMHLLVPLTKGHLSNVATIS